MKITLLVLLICTLSSKAYSSGIYTNYDLDTTVFDIGEPLNLWINFLKTEDDSLGAKYWNKAELEKYSDSAYFLAENELQFGSDNFLKLLTYTNIKILSVRQVGEYHKITSIIEFDLMEEGESNIQYILHVYAGLDEGELKLFNALGVNTKLNLNSSQVGFIKFHYPKYHEFNYDLANKLNDFVIDFSENFDVPLDTIDYYFAPTNEEIQRIKGFDFLIGDNGKGIPSGKADADNRIVYSTGLGEYYPHEIIHILINPYFPNCHLWLNEGLATYFGMSRGKELDWHLRKVNLHLQNNPDINLSNMLDYMTIDQYTNFKYALGGYIIGKVFEKGGYQELKGILKSGKTDEEFYGTISKYLGVKRENLNEYIRNELKTRFE
ncbi:MAG: hypothetical protein R2863_12510 [Candidatus Kapaibacterium sp.]|nr:hypothetical protein [Ignavibacteriota bacterium]